MNHTWMWIGLAFCACRVLQQVSSPAGRGMEHRRVPSTVDYLRSGRHAELPAAVAGNG